MCSRSGRKWPDTSLSGHFGSSSQTHIKFSAHPPSEIHSWQFYIDAVYPPSKASNIEFPEGLFIYNTTLDFILNAINTLLDDSSSQFIESCIKDEEYEESDYNLGMRDNLLYSCMAHYPFENKLLIDEDGSYGGS